MEGAGEYYDRVSEYEDSNVFGRAGKLATIRTGQYFYRKAWGIAESKKFFSPKTFIPTTIRSGGLFAGKRISLASKMGLGYLLFGYDDIGDVGANVAFMGGMQALESGIGWTMSQADMRRKFEANLKSIGEYHPARMKTGGKGYGSISPFAGMEEMTRKTRKALGYKYEGNLYQRWIGDRFVNPIAQRFKEAIGAGGEESIIRRYLEPLDVGPGAFTTEEVARGATKKWTQRNRRVAGYTREIKARQGKRGWWRKGKGIPRKEGVTIQSWLVAPADKVAGRYQIQYKRAITTGPEGMRTTRTKSTSAVLDTKSKVWQRAVYRELEITGTRTKGDSLKAIADMRTRRLSTWTKEFLRPAKPAVRQLGKGIAKGGRLLGATGAIMATVGVLAAPAIARGFRAFNRGVDRLTEGQYLDFGAGSVPLAGAAISERQRALQAMSNANMNARGAMGREAALYH